MIYTRTNKRGEPSKAAPSASVLEEFVSKRARYLLEMEEVAEAAARTIARAELTRRVLEVRDGRELGEYGLAIEPAVVQVLAGLLGVLLVAELDVCVAEQVVAYVLDDD